MEKQLKEHRKKANEFHNRTNCSYDGKEYVIHLDMVVEGIGKYETIFKNNKDYRIAAISGFYHDTIEDAQLSFNDVAKATNKRVARVVLAVTDVHEENRLLRHLSTMNKTVKNYIALIVKMADMRANGLYSKNHGSTMYRKYVAEYQYRKPIFKMALKWYANEIDMEIVDEFWKELDWIHDGEQVMETKSKFNHIAFKEYVNTYTKTGTGCDNDDIILQDLLYGIGIGLNEKKYSGADGFKKFKDYLANL